MNQDQKIIYYAGFFDGEGYVGFGYRGRLEIRIVNTHKGVLDELADDYGGGVYQRKEIARRRQAYEWALTKQSSVYRFLSDVWPYLIVKREVVDTILVIKKSLVPSKQDI